MIGTIAVYSLQRHWQGSFGPPTAALCLMFDSPSFLTSFASLKSQGGTPAFLPHAAMRRMLPGQVTARSGELQGDSDGRLLMAARENLPIPVFRELGHSSYLCQALAVQFLKGCFMLL